MKHQQGKYMIGYIKIIIKGKRLEEVLQTYIENGYPIWDIRRESRAVCYATIYHHHLKYLERLISENGMTISKIKVGGGTSLVSKILKKKEWLLAIIFCILLLFLIGNTAWKVEVQGVSVHLEDEIKANLAERGLYRGAWVYNLHSLDHIQDQLLNEIPELLYIGIQKHGTTYHIEAIEKKIEKQLVDSNVKKLIARKSGMIQKMFIKSGNPIVKINEFVEKGDTLVINEVDITDEAEEESKERDKIPVNGKVYANTWYEIAVSASLHPSKQQLTGEKTIRYQLQLDDKSLPIWGFGQPPYERNVINENAKPIHLWKWRLPVEIIEQNIYEYDAHVLKKSITDTKTRAIQQVENHLRINLGQDIEILKNYVLHETVENGKVKMKIYFSVLENIATAN